MIDLETLRRDYFGTYQSKLSGEWADWFAGYQHRLEVIRSTAEAPFKSTDFQKSLWTDGEIASVGAGSSVSVEGAYGDKRIADYLWTAHNWTRPASPDERGRTLQKIYDDVIAMVTPRYNARRPRARLVRLLAGLFPDDMLCILDHHRLWQLHAQLGLQQVEGDAVAQHPMIREHFCQVVGPAATTAERVAHSIFSWFAWSQYCEQPEAGAIELASAGRGKPSDVPELAILPAEVQRRGLSIVSNNIELLVTMVRESEQGISRSDLVRVIQQAAPLLSASSAANIISQAQGGLGLITISDGAYRPTNLGRSLMKERHPGRVLQPVLLTRIFGFAHLLLRLRAEDHGLVPQQLIQDIQRVYSGWTTSRAPSSLLQWALATALVKYEGVDGVQQAVLTEDGEYWASALPSDFADRWKLDAIAVPPTQGDGDPASTTSGLEPLATVRLSELLRHFRDGGQSARLIFPDQQLAELHAALHSNDHKRFVLLAGLSGTGKTSIARGYADAYCRCLGIDRAAHYCEVAVRPDWSDPSGLIGFINTLTDPPSFQSTNALNFLLRAHDDRSRPYFLCLDEMNLARVEHYFAPFLSAMEGEGASLTLHGERETIDNVPPQIPWLANLFIFGTVNMDESTHSFSDKVLDRAFTFEFWDADLGAWAGRKRASGQGASIVDEVSSVLQTLYAALQPARRHFGYRTADEVLAFCQAAGEAVPLSQRLDAAVFMKILPRLRGDDTGPLGSAIAAAEAIAKDRGFERTRTKIAAMRASLEATGQARFWS